MTDNGRLVISGLFEAEGPVRVLSTARATGVQGCDILLARLNTRLNNIPDTIRASQLIEMADISNQYSLLLPY